MADQPILDLLTVEARPTVRIDGEAYVLRTAQDLTLHENDALRAGGARVGALSALKRPTARQKTALSQTLDRLCRMVLLAPRPVQRRLKDPQRIQVLTVFTTLSTQRLERQRAALGAPGASPSRGTKPSRGSSASTAATSRRGSTDSHSAPSRRS